MNCQDAQKLLHAYSDGELDLVRSLEVEEHLSSCAACAEQQTNLRTLHDALSSRSLRYAAPDSLRARIQLEANPVAPQTPKPQSWLRPLALAAGIFLLVGGSATLAILFSRGGNRASGLEDWVIASHVRSLQVNHLTDVVSSDRHTVKPWFRDKLDFSPQVPDLTAQGFPLAGGRLDYLDGRAVAALVYQRGKHAINVFTWPATNGRDESARDFDRQGFHIRAWQQAGMNYWAISDVNETDLDQFVRLFREQTADSRP